MTLGLAIAGIVAALVAAFGGAWYGGRLQRSSNLETLTLELQIDAASKFLGAVGDATLAYSQWDESRLQADPAKRAQPSWQALVGFRVQASAVGIVGPDELSDIARDILAQAMVIDATIISVTFPGETVAEAAQLEIGRLAQEFEAEARRLLRPTSRQKIGRAQRIIAWVKHPLSRGKVGVGGGT